MPNTSGQSMPFVTRFEMAVMQYVILHKAKEGEVTRDNLASTFKGNMQMESDHLDHCLNELVQDGHLKEVGGKKYTATDDGREDVQKLQTLVMELGSVVGGRGQGAGSQGGQQKQGSMPTTQGGVGNVNPSGGGAGSTTGTTQGNQGTFGSNKR